MNTNKTKVQKYFSILILVLFIQTITVSCNQNKLKTNEDELVKTILTEEEQLAYETELRNEQEKQLADSLAKLPKGFRFIEERNVDTDNPPHVIDIATRFDSIKDFSLSSVATSIEYIRIEAIPDSTLLTNMKYKYYLMDNYIVATNLYGIFLFDKEGHYIRTIVKNQLGGITYNDKKDRIMFLWSDYMRIGGSPDLWARGNDLFYAYRNTLTGQGFIMEYDCSTDSPIENLQFEPENPNKIMAAGRVSVDLNYGREPKPSKKRSQGAMTMSADHFYSQTDIFAPDRNVTIHVTGGEHMLNIRNNNGEIITTFKKLEQLKNFTSSISRGTDNGTRYEKNGDLYFRTDFNDTIFKVVPPNHLLPIYVLNLGEYKLTKQQGMDPGFDLNGKIIPQDFAETKDFLFLTFTKDSYDCPHNRRSKSLKLYRAIYSKKDKQLFIVKGDPTEYDAPILRNDIDGGLHVWPNAMMIGSKGEIMVSLLGSEIKAQVHSNSFKQSTVPEDKKETLRQLATKVSDAEQVLMIVK